ncbi:MAG: alpha/beta hydrolase [Methylacidiphilales bacterium]|nr:alpha/beta hydrolase [Candidatus Methylacidiphilales bacterium]
MTLSTAAPVVPLWDGPVPRSLGSSANDIPDLTPFLPTNATPGTPAIIIFPGGGYEFLASIHEGTNEGEYFQNRGIAAFVLKYRLPVHGYRHPVPLLDAQRAIRLVRSRAADWKIDPAKVGIMGFSAGGHLAATADTHFDAGNPQAADPVDRVSSRPDFAVLVYAVVSLKIGTTHQGSKNNLLGPDPDPALIENLSNETQVTPQTPPTILVHSVDDDAVPIENSRLMFAALQKAGVPSRLDEYPTGGHGFGFGPGYDHGTNQVKAPAGWLDRVHDWLKDRGFFGLVNGRR